MSAYSNDAAGWEPIGQNATSNGWTIQQGDEQIKPVDVRIVKVHSFLSNVAIPQDTKDAINGTYWTRDEEPVKVALLAAVDDFIEDLRIAQYSLSVVRHTFCTKGTKGWSYHLIQRASGYLLLVVASDGLGVDYNVSAPEAEIYNAVLAHNSKQLLG